MERFWQEPDSRCGFFDHGVTVEMPKLFISYDNSALPRWPDAFFFCFFFDLSESISSR
jgi:hypothetical protein